MKPLQCVSPIDGRYHRKTEDLSRYFSEAALHHHRQIVEVKYFEFVLKRLVGYDLTPDERTLLQGICDNFDLDEAQICKDIEVRGYEGIPATNHDVKAVEYYLKLKLKGTSLEEYIEWIHFALTSEDVTNLAYAMMLGQTLTDVLVPVYEKFQDVLGELIDNHDGLAMLSRTHGQPASPTTFGKEFKIFEDRLSRQFVQLVNFAISVKLNGASGNYCAHFVAFPDVNWITFSDDFIRFLFADYEFSYEVNHLTAQIEPHDTYAELFDNLRRVNTILIDFCQDMWRYISDDWVVQKPVEGEIGSSAMPHKVNPIDFENAEGNLGLANVLCEFFSRKLPISRLQRDLSDSTVERNFGVAFAHSLIAYKSILKGLSKVHVSEENVLMALGNNPQILAEAIQTILRREGLPMPYEQLKALTRGRKITMFDITTFIAGLDVDDELKQELHLLRPDNYLGIAKALAGGNF